MVTSKGGEGDDDHKTSGHVVVQHVEGNMSHHGHLKPNCCEISNLPFCGFQHFSDVDCVSVWMGDRNWNGDGIGVFMEFGQNYWVAVAKTSYFQKAVLLIMWKLSKMHPAPNRRYHLFVVP